MMESFRLAGQTALVTGARRGIGAALAQALGEAGAMVIGIGRQECDFSNRASLREFVRKLDVPVDILLNNAGMIRRAPAVEYSDTDWDEVIEVNLTAQFILAREIGRQMLARGRGKIIFIASLLSFQGGITIPAYAASKGGVAQLTKALANEWAGKGINVNAIAPGYMRTDNTKALQADETRNRTILERLPGGRWCGPFDFFGAVLFLA